MSRGGILALDLAQRTGWAFGSTGARSASGVWVLPPMIEPGRTFNALVDVLSDAIAELSPALVVMEAPLHLAAQTLHATAYQQFGLAAMTDMVCERHETSVRQVSVQDARRAVLGKSRGWDKPEIVAWCQANGFPETVDHNEADATVVWLYACRLFKPGAARVAA